MKPVAVKFHCRDHCPTIGKSSDVSGVVLFVLTAVIGAQRGAVIIGGDAGQHPPVPIREDVLIFPPGLHHYDGSVGRKLCQQILGVGKFVADCPFGLHTHRGIPILCTIDSEVGTRIVPCADQFVFIKSRLEVLKGDMPEHSTARAIHRGHVRQGYGTGIGLAAATIDVELTSARTRIHHALPYRPAQALKYIVLNDFNLLLRKGIVRTLEYTRPKRYTVGECQSVVAKLHLGAVLMERPVFLDAFVVRHVYLLAYLPARLPCKLRVFYEQSFHHLIPGKPCLVLPRASETGTFKHSQCPLNLLFGKFVPQEQHRRGQLFGHPDIVVPPVGVLRPVVEPPTCRLVEQFAQQRRLVERRLRPLVGFCKSIYPCDMQGHVPSAPRHVRVVDVPPLPPVEVE